MTTVYGYVRVSTKEQKEDRQLLAMAEQGIAEENLFVDKMSGKDFKRPAYRRMIRLLKADDVVVVKSIDRLGRDYTEIMEQWRIITKKKRADIKVLDTPLLDTTYCKDLLGTFIADLVLAVMSYTAESERANIRQRQSEGIQAARARGVQFGRPQKQMPENFSQLYRKWREGDMTTAAFAEQCQVSKSTLYGWLKYYKDENNQWLPAE